MRYRPLLGLMLAGALTAHCHRRAPLTQEPQQPIEETIPLATTSETEKEEEAIHEAEPAAEPIATTEAVPISEAEMMSREVPMPAQPSNAARIEPLAFSHQSTLCVQAQANGQVSLQVCDATAPGQMFFFARSLDGRYQLKDMSSQLCLGIRAGGFFAQTTLVAESCESKASQFFTVVDYGTSYSLRFDANNTCIDAEDNGIQAGTRIILFRCTSGLNQKILVRAP